MTKAKATLIVGLCALLCIALVVPAGAVCPVSWRDKNLTYTRACTIIDMADNVTLKDLFIQQNRSASLADMVALLTTNVTIILSAEQTNRTHDYNTLLVSEAQNRTHDTNELYLGTDLNLTRSASGETKNISEASAGVLSTVSDWIQDPSNKTMPYSPTGHPAVYNISNESGMVEQPLYDTNGAFGRLNLVNPSMDYGIKPNGTITLTGLYFRLRFMNDPYTCENFITGGPATIWKIWHSPPTGEVELLGNTSVCDIPGPGNVSWVGVRFDHPVRVTPDDIIGFHSDYGAVLSTLPMDQYYSNNQPYYGDFGTPGFIMRADSGWDVMGSTEDPAISARIAEDVAASGDASTLVAAKGADEHIVYDVEGTETNSVSSMVDIGFSFNETQTLSELYVKMRLRMAPFTCEVSDNTNLTWKIWQPYGTDPIILGNTSICDIPIGGFGSPNASAWIGLKFGRTIQITPNDIVGFTPGMMTVPLEATTKSLWDYYPDNLPWMGQFGSGFPSKALQNYAPDVTNKLEVENKWPVPAVASAKTASIAASVVASNKNHTPLIYDARGAGISTIQMGGSDYGFVFNASATLDSLYIRARLQNDPTISPGTCQDVNVTFRVWRSPPTSDPEYLGNVPLCDIPFGPDNASVWVGVRFDHAVTVTPSDIIGFDMPSGAALEGPQMGSFEYYPDFQPKWGLFWFNGGFLANNAPDVTTRPEIEWQAEAKDAVVENRITVGVETNASIMEDRITVGTNANLTARSGATTFWNGTDMPLYNLTDTWTEISALGTSQSLNFTTPSAGMYFVTVDLRENWTIETTTPPAYYMSEFALCDATGADIVPGTIQAGTTLVMESVRLDGEAMHHYTWLYGNATGPTEVKVCGHVTISTNTLDGEWSVRSDDTIKTILGWMRLA